MKRTTVNVCYQKMGSDYLIYKGSDSYHFGSINYLSFFKILNREQNKYIQDNYQSRSFATNTLKLSFSQFIELVGLVKPNNEKVYYFEQAVESANKLKDRIKRFNAKLYLKKIRTKTTKRFELTEEKKLQLILRKFHGFTEPQWKELVKQFPYSEIPHLVKMVWDEAKSTLK